MSTGYKGDHSARPLPMQRRSQRTKTFVRYATKSIMVNSEAKDPIGTANSASNSGSKCATMVDCLDSNDPVAALQAIATGSANEAIKYAKELQELTSGTSWQVEIPPNLSRDAILSLSEDQNSHNHSTPNHDHPLRTVAACAESVASSLNKIASGGSEASQEIRVLEQEKRDLESHAAAIQAAVSLRQQSSRAAQSYAAAAWNDTAEALRPWLLWKQQNTETSSENAKSKEAVTILNDPRVAMYAGEYSLQQLANTYDKLRTTLLDLYENAVQASNLQVLGQLTPILSILQLEPDGLRLYKVFLESVLERSMKDAVTGPPPPANPKGDIASPPPYAAMGRVYNAAVAVLRHHLPMVSHCLHRADGDVAVVQLVHVQTEGTVIPLIQQYQREKQLSRVARTAGQIYAALEERYTGRGLVDENDVTGGMEDANDCGFSVQIGSLADVDVAMEEAAMCIQHAESYLRFVQHTCLEVNRARELRHQQARERARLERERYEWTSGKSNGHAAFNDSPTDDADENYHKVEILPTSTPLHESIAEIGGQYAAIERCLLLASMQRTFVNTNDDDPRSYRPMSTLQATVGKNGATNIDAWQTSLVEACFYATGRSTQRAFATGHAGTASAVTNFAVECLTDVCVEVLSRRSEELGVHPLKPGEGLLVGSANLFNNASSLIRQGGGAVTGGSIVLQLPATGVAAANKTKTDELIRKQKREEGIARACAMLNDLEVAIHHTQQLESVLNKSIEKGFSANTHETEHLRMCVKSLGPVADAFKLASNSTIESLESLLKPRVRSIVGDAVGSDSSTFMGATSSVMGGGKSGDREMIRMNYDLDEEAYNLLQLSEGYVSRLCTLLDDLLLPLRRHLAPRLWDTLLLSVISTACKRLETSLRKCQYTALGGLALDADMRDLLAYTKNHLQNTEHYGNSVAVTRACPALSKLLQIAKVLSVDDLDDVLDLIIGSKRKGNWDLKLEDAKAFLGARVEFDSSKVDELLRLPEDD
jgi:conserved oligomeric Golgi complex subunit 4